MGSDWLGRAQIDSTNDFALEYQLLNLLLLFVAALIYIGCRFG